MGGYCIIKTTIDSEISAKKIIEKLLKERLISCAQISKIESLYWWDNQIQNNNEFVIEMKTKKNLYKKVETEIIELHDYEVPEMVCIDIIDGYKKFLKWIDMETI